MRKRGAEIRPEQAATSSVIDALLRELTAQHLERVAASVIREYRLRLQKAQDVFDEMERLEATGGRGETLDDVKRNYCVALLGLHAQHEVVSIVVNALGFMPQVDHWFDVSDPPN